MERHETAMFIRRGSSRGFVALALLGVAACVVVDNASASPAAKNTAAKNTAADDTSAKSTQEETWHARLGVSVNPVLDAEDYLPIAKTGFGGSVSAFYRLPYRLGVGAGVDLDRYTYDSSNHGDGPYGPPRYVDQQLLDVRAQALLQWDWWARDLINPYLLIGAGYVWQHAELTDWQCHPRQRSGPIGSVGAGLDVALGSAVGVGVEYRVNTPPLTGGLCTGVQIDDEPRGAPRVTNHRLGLTVSVRH
jgi:opacity protein-like surface antigen